MMLEDVEVVVFYEHKRILDRSLQAVHDSKPLPRRLRAFRGGL